MVTFSRTKCHFFTWVKVVLAAVQLTSIPRIGHCVTIVLLPRKGDLIGYNSPMPRSWTVMSWKFSGDKPVLNSLSSTCLVLGSSFIVYRT